MALTKRTRDNVFRYMCGVLWNKVNEMQDGAKAIIEAGGH